MLEKLFKDKVAIITGGSRGLGAAIAQDLASRGANVLITYNSAKDDAEIIAHKITKLGREAVIVQGNGTDRSAPERIVATAVQKWGHIDIIINNAGAGDDALLEDLTHELWDKLYDTNVRLPTFLVKAALPYFGPAPRIVNISSVAARAGTSYMSAYASSKAALEGITRVWAHELGQKYNATVNCVNPGPIATDMWLRDTDAAILAEWDERMKETPAGARIATVDDIVPIVAFLSHESSRWSTGSVVNANGGLIFV
ncbi:gluconate 5-dehydrogenase [Pochonia chlamydosporia 170]|uniref:Gluconate 5-dehydrogenase n=1 Tax=Pochonia chlamydosporia 170 TaxID=1380566 RepID=A0A179F1Z2_METCM|nr:gluconate 5-dehydrogenase [Pochonia chlamydosporia 170]OAQ59109.1 gluconate 5-dehydrogenase [Pochonia chlamydosporia 170]